MTTVLGFAERLDSELKEVLGKAITDLADSPANTMEAYQRRLGAIDGYRTALTLLDEAIVKLTAVRTQALRD